MSNAIDGLELRKLAGNATVTLGRQLTAGLLQLATVIIIARVFGPENFGQYAVTFLLPSMLATFLNLGIAPANVYFLGAGKVDTITVFRTINRLALYISIVGLCTGVSIILFFGDKWFPNVPHLFLWIALSIFPFALYQSFLSSIFQGLQRFRVFNLILLTQPIVILFLVIILVLFKIMSPQYVLVIHLIGSVVMVGIGLLKIREEIIQCNPSDKHQGYIKQAVTYGYKAHLSNILAFVNYKADIFLVNMLINPAAAGIYVVAVRLAERLWLLSQSVSTVILPRLSELSLVKENRKLLTPIICRTVVAVTLASAILLACLAYPLIALFFGAEYFQAIKALLFLLPGIVAGSGARILANDIAARGRPELNMYFSIIVVIINITGNILLIPIYGLVGAAVATSSAYLLNFLLRLVVYKRISGNGLMNSILLTTDDIMNVVTALKRKNLMGDAK